MNPTILNVFPTLFANRDRTRLLAAVMDFVGDFVFLRSVVRPRWFAEQRSLFTRAFRLKTSGLLGYRRNLFIEERSRHHDVIMTEYWIKILENNLKNGFDPFCTVESFAVQIYLTTYNKDTKPPYKYTVTSLSNWAPGSKLMPGCPKKRWILFETLCLERVLTGLNWTCPNGTEFYHDKNYDNIHSEWL